MSKHPSSSAPQTRGFLRSFLNWTKSQKKSHRLDEAMERRLEGLRDTLAETMDDQRKTTEHLLDATDHLHAAMRELDPDEVIGGIADEAMTDDEYERAYGPRRKYK